jgi:hypothetical protein
MKRTIINIAVVFCCTLAISACDNTTSVVTDSNSEEVTSNETAEPTLIGKWRLVNFEMDGKVKFDECDAGTIWDFTTNQVGNYQGKKLFALTAAIEDPACRLYGFSAEWEEIDEDATEVYIDNVKVGKGTNKGGVFKINELTTKTLVLQGGTWLYSFER